MCPRRQDQPLNPARACVNCQKRKSRCQPSGPGAPCSYCARAGKECSFGRPPDRTRLTRKNLDAVEHRCGQLQALLRSMHPELDIEAALTGLETVGSDDEDPEEREEPAHEFEWHEALIPPDDESPAGDLGGMDGMATLSSLDAGYLGSSSGSTLLQEIASMLPDFPPTTSPSNSHGVSPGTRALAQHLDPPGLAFTAMTGYLIDAYFLFYNVSYPILHEKTFREKAASRGIKGGRCSWNVVYFLVLAIGHWVSTSDAHHARSNFHTKARASFSIQMLESGTLETVQALLLMSNYLQKMDRPNTGYNFMGVAYKMALGLGLHREPSGVEANVGHERRRLLFWVVYCFDSGFNITTGRPPNATEGIIDTNVPRNIDDKDLEPTSPIPEPLDSPTPLSAIIAQANLAKHANALYHEYLMAKTANTKVEYQLSESMDRTLSTWRHSLPHYFTSPDAPAWFLGPRAVVLWKEQNLRILLWRGSKRRHGFLPSRPDAETRCLDIAMQTIHDITGFCDVSNGGLHLGIIWYATYFLFQAALVLEASYLNKEAQQKLDEETSAWRMVVSKAHECLTTLAQKSKSAHRCLEVLDLIHRRTGAMRSEIVVPQPIDGGEDLSANPPPLTTQNSGDIMNMGIDEAGLNDASDPTMRMILDNTPWGYLDNTPMDAFLNDWIYPVPLPD